MATATKAPAKRVATAKKAAAPKAAAPENGETPAPAKRTRAKSEVEGSTVHELKPTGMEDEVVRLREDEKLKWDEIADRMGATTGRVLMAWNIAKVGNRRLKGTQEERAAEIPRLREELHSWGQIAAIVNLNEGFVRSEYQRLTGVSSRGLRVGRGGKYPNDMPDSERPVREVKPKAPPKTKVEDTGRVPTKDLDLDGLKERLTQRSIQVSRDGNNETLKVKEVKNLKNGTVTLVSDKGATRSFKVEAITKISKQKVAV